jgi:hypothetical protein
MLSGGPGRLDRGVPCARCSLSTTRVRTFVHAKLSSRQCARQETFTTDPAASPGCGSAGRRTRYRCMRTERTLMPSCPAICTSVRHAETKQAALVPAGCGCVVLFGPLVREPPDQRALRCSGAVARVIAEPRLCAARPLRSPVHCAPGASLPADGLRLAARTSSGNRAGTGPPPPTP